MKIGYTNVFGLGRVRKLPQQSRFHGLPATIFIALALSGCDNGNDRMRQGWVEAELIFVGPDEQGRLETLGTHEGDRAENGVLLFTLDEDLQQADVVVKKAAVLNAQQNFNRAKELLHTTAGTQKAYEDSEAVLRQANANLAASEIRLAHRKVFSPSDGTIQQVYYRPGEAIPAGQPVVALLPPQNIKLRFFASEALLPEITLGATVSVSCDGCQSGLTAKVSFIARTAEFTPQ